MVLGVGHKSRRVYKIWEEECRVPEFVLKVSSYPMVDRDQGFKKDGYRDLGVREYLQLDTTADLLKRRLLGHRLQCGKFEQIKALGGQDGCEEYGSDVLGLYLRAVWSGSGARLAFRNPLTGEDVPTGEAMDRMHRESERGRSAERRGRFRAEMECDAETHRRRRIEQKYRVLEAKMRETGALRPELPLQTSLTQASEDVVGEGRLQDLLAKRGLMSTVLPYRIQTLAPVATGHSSSSIANATGGEWLRR